MVTKVHTYVAELPFVGTVKATIEYSSSHWACITYPVFLKGEVAGYKSVAYKNFDARPVVARDVLKRETGYYWKLGGLHEEI